MAAGNSTPASQFSSQNTTAEDLLRAQTVGLVQLNDFKKRRADVLEMKEREGSRGGAPGMSGGEGADSPRKQPAGKKKKKLVKRGALSFGVDEDEEDGSGDVTARSSTSTPVTDVSAMPVKGGTPTPTAQTVNEQSTKTATTDGNGIVRRLGYNTSIGHAPKVMTKAALLKEAQTREQLRKEFLVQRDAVRATEILIPFVFYDGTDIPGGVCRVKKGEHVWLFLDKARKVGAQSGAGAGAGGDKDRSRREWARVGVDDLMLVRGEIIVPHHYEFYYFIANQTQGFHGPLFDYSARLTRSTPAAVVDPSTQPDFDPLLRPGKRMEKAPSTETAELEGADDETGLTKVVDRRWYEKNKHIFPASVWEEFDPGKDYTTGIRKDTEGNQFFFS